MAALPSLALLAYRDGWNQAQHTAEPYKFPRALTEDELRWWRNGFSDARMDVAAEFAALEEVLGELRARAVVQDDPARPIERA